MVASSYLGRFLEPVAHALTPEVAQAFVDLRADLTLEAHVEELRQKANQGTMTPEEEADYKDFVEAVDVISILQAKARQYLSKCHARV